MPRTVSALKQLRVVNALAKYHQKCRDNKCQGLNLVAITENAHRGSHGASWIKGIGKDLLDLGLYTVFGGKGQGSGALFWIGCCQKIRIINSII